MSCFPVTIQIGNASGELALTAGGAEKVRIKNNGSVGVGTSSPDARFEVVNSSTSEVEVARFRSEGNTNNPMLRVMVDESTGEAAIRSSGSAVGNLILGSGNNDHLTIATNGRVGIGTTSPSTLLHLSASSPRLQLTDADTGVDHRFNADSSVGNLAIDVDLNSEASTPSLICNIKGSEKL